MNIIFSYELLYPPYDEGVKKLAYMICQTLKKKHQVTVLRNIPYLPNVINSILIMPRIIISSLFKKSDKIIYIPKGALTFSAIIKVWLASFFLGEKFVVVSVQRKILSRFQKKIVMHITLRNIFTLSSALADELLDLGIHAKVLTTGIDLDRFTPNNANKKALRKKYNLPENKKILLHVGHIRETRNILWLQDVQNTLPDIQVVIIGSTATEQDDHIRVALESSGVIILRQSLPEVQEVYQASDIYCFPVTELQGAMEIPLSVLEAMAVNLPIITTKFGRLPELFDEDKHYKYFNNSAEIISILKTNFDENCLNRKKLSPFTWEHTASTLIAN